MGIYADRWQLMVIGFILGFTSAFLFSWFLWWAVLCYARRLARKTSQARKDVALDRLLAKVAVDLADRHGEQIVIVRGSQRN